MWCDLEILYLFLCQREIKWFKSVKIFLKRTVYSAIKYNTWGTDLADIQLISYFNKGSRFLLCVTDIFSKYVWLVYLKYEKGATIVNAFQKVLDKSGCKPNKIWVDKGS